MNNYHPFTQILLVAILMLSNIANATPPNPYHENHIIIENKEIVFSIDDSSNEKLFISSKFSSGTKTIHLETTDIIGFLQLMNDDGDIEYQLPVSSKNIHMDISEFTKGTYRLNLLVQSTNKYISTEIKKLF